MCAIIEQSLSEVISTSGRDMWGNVYSALKLQGKGDLISNYILLNPVAYSGLRY